MKRRISLHNRLVSYSLRRSKRAERLRLAVYCDGNFVVTIPKGISESTAERYILNRAQWILDKLNFFNKATSIKLPKLGKRDYLKNKDAASKIAQERVEYFNKVYGYKYNDITIRNQKTRWGSCSKKRNLNFNYKIMFLPPKLRDYIIVHELCHLKEFNHSQKFWNLVAKAIPDYTKLTNDLKYKGLSIS